MAMHKWREILRKRDLKPGFEGCVSVQANVWGIRTKQQSRKRRSAEEGARWSWEGCWGQSGGTEIMGWDRSGKKRDKSRVGSGNASRKQLWLSSAAAEESWKVAKCSYFAVFLFKNCCRERHLVSDTECIQGSWRLLMALHTSSGSDSLNSQPSPVQLMKDWQDLSVSSSSRNCQSWMGPLPVRAGKMKSIKADSATSYLACKDGWNKHSLRSWLPGNKDVEGLKNTFWYLPC